MRAKNKKRLAAMFCLLIGLSAVLAGCGGSGSSGGSAQSSDRTEKNGGVEEVLEAWMQEQDDQATPDQAAPEVSGQEVSGQGDQAASEVSGQETPEVDQAASAVQETPEVGQAGQAEAGAAATDVDVDLTVLSATMVYSEVFSMTTNPKDYIGKSVRMRGDLAYFKDEATGKEYFACIIRDATACCAQGIEFELAGDYKYPDDYPELGSEITVSGVFDTYSEGEGKYVTLRNAVME